MTITQQIHSTIECLKRMLMKINNTRQKQKKLLWHYLTNNKLGLHFRRQHIIGCYIADFICLKKKLIIEVDGGYHSQQEQIIKDYYRTEHLLQMGFNVIRFTNEEIFSKLPEVLDIIFNKIAEPKREG